MELSVAYMSSSGRQFPEIVQVHGILGQRAIARGLMSEVSLQTRLMELCESIGVTDYPSSATTRRWAASTPSYPEQAITMGLVSAELLSPWARPFANVNPPTALLQQARQERGEADIVTTVFEGIMVVGLCLLAAKLLQELFAPAPPAPSPLRRLSGPPPLPSQPQLPHSLLAFLYGYPLR